MDDNEIMEVLLNNPHEGLKELIGKYRGLVGKIASNILGKNERDIEETAADTFINIWKNASSFNPERGTLKGLIVCVARNQAINRWKKLKNENVEVFDDLDFLSSNDVLDELIKKQDEEELQGVILEMSEPDREIFVRRYYLMESVKVISDHVDMNEKQVSNRLYQSKLRLRKIIQERGFYNEKRI